MTCSLVLPMACLPALLMSSCPVCFWTYVSFQRPIIASARDQAKPHPRNETVKDTRRGGRARAARDSGPRSFPAILRVLIGLVKNGTPVPQVEEYSLTVHGYGTPENTSHRHAEKI